MSVQVISPAELAAKCQSSKKMTLIDVRTPIEFQEVHIQQAKNVPLDQLQPAAMIQSQLSTTDEPIYIVCRSGSRGKQACEKFIQAGYTNVINVDGGTMACIEAGLPVTRGKKMMSLERQVRIAAGFLVVVGVTLGWLVHPACYGLAGFVGAGLVFAGVTDTCAMGLLIAKMPWNRVSNTTATCAR